MSQCSPCLHHPVWSTSKVGIVDAVSPVCVVKTAPLALRTTTKQEFYYGR